MFFLGGDSCPFLFVHWNVKKPKKPKNLKTFSKKPRFFSSFAFQHNTFLCIVLFFARQELNVALGTDTHNSYSLVIRDVKSSGLGLKALASAWSWPGLGQQQKNQQPRRDWSVCLPTIGHHTMNDTIEDSYYARDYEKLNCVVLITMIYTLCLKKRVNFETV